MTIARTKDGRSWSSIYPIAPCPQCGEPIELRALPHYARDADGRIERDADGRSVIAWNEIDPAPNCECYEVAGYSQEEEDAIAIIAARHYSRIDGDTDSVYRLLTPAEYPDWLKRRRHRYANIRV